MDRDYIISERFIWDDLLRRGEAVARRAKKIFDQQGSINTTILSWPSKTIKGDDGKDINRIVALAVPKNIPIKRALIDMTKRTFPYALLLTEVQNDELKIILESHHGTRSWRFPIQRKGDVLRLGEGVTKDDVDSIGILWKRHASGVDS